LGETQEYHGTGGYLTIRQFNDHPKLADDIMDAAAELGYRSRVDLNGEDSIGFTIAQANNRDGARLSTNKAFIRPILNRPNLFISTESMVSRNNRMAPYSALTMLASGQIIVWEWGLW
jgi:choline dehydrogenase